MEIARVKCEIDKRQQRRKKGSETVKCRENMGMNYSVIILSDSSLQRLSFFFARRYSSGTSKQPDLWNEILKSSYLHACRSEGSAYMTRQHNPQPSVVQAQY